MTTPPPTIPREAPATEVGSAPNSAQQPSAPPAEVLQALPPPPAPPHPPYQVHASSPTPSSQLPPPLNAPRQLGSNSAQHFPRVCSSSLVPITETSATVLPVLPGQKPSSPPYHPSLPFCPSLTREPNPTYSPFWPQVPNCRLSCAGQAVPSARNTPPSPWLLEDNSDISSLISPQLSEVTKPKSLKSPDPALHFPSPLFPPYLPSPPGSHLNPTPPYPPYHFLEGILLTCKLIWSQFFQTWPSRILESEGHKSRRPRSEQQGERLRGWEVAKQPRAIHSYNKKLN